MTTFRRTCSRCETTYEFTEGNPPCPNCGPAPAAPLDEQAPTPARRPTAGRKVLLGVFLGCLALLAAVVLLAETGAVTSETSESKWTAEGKNKAEYEWAGPRGRAAVLRGVRFSPTVVVGAARGDGHALATEAANAIRKSVVGGGGAGQAKLEITITRVTPAGATWVPFVKNGSCTFAATYTLAAETPWSSFAGAGEVTGTVTQSMTGLCSTGLFREKMAQSIAAAILSDVSKMVAKYS